MWEEDKNQNAWAKLAFKSPTTIAGLGVIAGNGAATKNPTYVNVKVYFKIGSKTLRRSLVRKLSWKSNQ